MQERNGDNMTKQIIIENPSENVRKFFDLMRERKHQQIEKMKKMEKGIFSIKV